ncbi:DUF7660 family protein [Wenjunlia vitaminophila]|uniref:DUF7660 family protein n=1 Tax=Wenjunlia vitaminophila TaxID=76728 RepID=UPI0012FE921D|nr:hypothetical protein [Wenjunlia vitaminophila]
MPQPLNPGDRIPDQDAFAAFLARLHEDCRQRGDQWENVTLERFLEALAAWVSTGPAWYECNLQEPLPSDGNWTYLAHALMAATMYE